MPKISANSTRVSPCRGTKCTSGGFKIGNFLQISGYISKTVQDRRTLSIKVKYKVVCTALCQMFHDIELPFMWRLALKNLLALAA